MEVFELALLTQLADFIGYIKSDCSARAVLDAADGSAGAAVRNESFSASLQEALRGKEGLDAAAVASSARRLLVGFKALFLCCAEVDRLATQATATGDDMDVDKEDMDVDGRPTPGARHRQEGSGRSCASVGSVAAHLPTFGAKRKRASGGGAEEVDPVPPLKRRRLLAWMRPHRWLPSGSGRVSSAPRRSRHARTVAMARSRRPMIRRPIGKPDARTVALAIQRRSQPSLGQHFSRISL